mmetsp:Transcript_19969/g.25925  ORF Transcript_19969/g.25925 Transcript_19969/m.25925 type:complete len:183 (+) Transcript_19969:191-739(+)
MDGLDLSIIAFFLILCSLSTLALTIVAAVGRYGVLRNLWDNDTVLIFDGLGATVLLTVIRSFVLIAAASSLYSVYLSCRKNYAGLGFNNLLVAIFCLVAILTFVVVEKDHSAVLQLGIIGAGFGSLIAAFAISLFSSGLACCAHTRMGRRLRRHPPPPPPPPRTKEVHIIQAQPQEVAMARV